MSNDGHPALAVRRRRAIAAGIAAVTTLAGALVVPAFADTTVTGGDAGTNPPVVRQSSVTVTDSLGSSVTVTVPAPKY